MKSCRGSSSTRIRRLIAKSLQPLGSNPSILHDLVFDSFVLQGLHCEFISVPGDYLHVVNYFERRKFCLFEVSVYSMRQICKQLQFLWFEKTLLILIQCVQEQSATNFGSQVENIGLRVDHYSLSKFGSRNTEYKLILLIESTRRAAPTVGQLCYFSHYFRAEFRPVKNYVQRPILHWMIKEQLHDVLEQGILPDGFPACHTSLFRSGRSWRPTEICGPPWKFFVVLFSNSPPSIKPMSRLIYRIASSKDKPPSCESVTLSRCDWGQDLLR